MLLGLDDEKVQESGLVGFKWELDVLSFVWYDTKDNIHMKSIKDDFLKKAISFVAIRSRFASEPSMNML